MPDQEARASLARSWLERLGEIATHGEPYLARGSTGEVFVVEERRRRAVSSTLLTAALAAALGRPRETTDAELAGLEEGPPVKVFEAPHGKPFVVVGGRRMAIRGLPLPHPVSDEDMGRFDEGAELDLAAANVDRARFQEAFTGRYQVRAARDALRRKGVVPTVTGWGRRAWRRARRITPG